MRRKRSNTPDGSNSGIAGDATEGIAPKSNIPIDTTIYTDTAGREYTKRYNLGGYVKDYKLRTTPFSYSQGITKVTHPDVLKAAGELETRKFEYMGSRYYWNARYAESTASPSHD